MEIDLERHTQQRRLEIVVYLQTIVVVIHHLRLGERVDNDPADNEVDHFTDLSSSVWWVIVLEFIKHNADRIGTWNEWRILNCKSY